MTIKLVIAKIIEHLEAILKGKNSQELNFISLKNNTNKHF